MRKIYQVFISLSTLLLFPAFSYATTFYTRGTGGNWGAMTTWSTVACNGATATSIPGIDDDVII